MSSTNYPPAPTAGQTAKSILDKLASLNAEVAIGVQVGETLYPIVKGVVQAIKDKVSGTTTVTYTIEVAAVEADLDAVVTVEEADLAEDNAELARLGIATIPDPNA